MKIIKSIAAIIGFSGVGLGAFGAHALKATLTARGSLDIWQTATQYHLVHAVAMLATVIAAGAGEDEQVRRSWIRCAWAFLVGVLLFSGSLYVLALGGPRWLGPVTPLGGAALLVGWFLVAFAGRRSAK
jgi:uncharacterized membrane protein YgdD (TMEM256/DUF423 family)